MALKCKLSLVIKGNGPDRQAGKAVVTTGKLMLCVLLQTFQFDPEPASGNDDKNKHQQQKDTKQIKNQR